MPEVLGGDAMTVVRRGSASIIYMTEADINVHLVK